MSELQLLAMVLGSAVVIVIILLVQRMVRRSMDKDKSEISKVDKLYEKHEKFEDGRKI